MGLENHCYRYGRLNKRTCSIVINVLVWKFYKERIVFAAARYNPTYKNKPDDAVHCRVFVFCKA
jgi:hypothetical protein